MAEDVLLGGGGGPGSDAVQASLQFVTFNVIICFELCIPS